MARGHSSRKIRKRRDDATNDSDANERLLSYTTMVPPLRLPLSVILVFFFVVDSASGLSSPMSRRAAMHQSLTKVAALASPIAILLGAPSSASAADCYKDCLKSCTEIAPKDPEYCEYNCKDFCDQSEAGEK